MNMLESKLTAALRETAEEVPGGSVPPLRLQPAPGGPGIAGDTRRRRWLARMTPLAAAAAVAGVLAGSLALSGTFGGGIQARVPAHGRAQGAPAGGRAALHGVPPYYVGLADPSEIMGGRRAQIRASTTGNVLATVRPPRPFGLFTWVSAAADDHTFILAAQRYWPIAPGNKGSGAERRDNTTPTWFFRLAFGPAAHTVRLTKLTSLGTVGSSRLAGIALSPDGTRLALDLRRSIQVISLATGAKRTWRWPGGGWVGNWKPFGQVLSWSADGKEIAFQQWSGGSPSIAHVRVLDTTAPGRSLSSARLVITFPASPAVLTLGGQNTLLTPDGTKIVAAMTKEAAKSPYATQLEVAELSARSGKVERSMDEFRLTGPGGGWQEALWSNSSGSTLIVSDPRGKNRQQVTGVLTGNHFTALPGNPQNQQIAW